MVASYKFLYKAWFEIHKQSVPQTPVSSYFQRKRSSISGKNQISCFGRTIPYWKTQNLNCCCKMSLVFRASTNVSFSGNNHILKFFIKGFKNLPSNFFLFWISVIKYWPVHGKFHSDIQNKMAGNNGTAPPHERDYMKENSM